MSVPYHQLNQLVAMGVLSEEDLSIIKDWAVPFEHLIDLLFDKGRMTKYQADLICNRRAEC